jgi:cytochrome c553
MQSLIPMNPVQHVTVASRRIAASSALGLFAACLAAPSHSADVAAGKQKAQSCAVCHGENGLSRTPDAPNLAGQPAIYLAQQLKNYRSGKRSNEVMNLIAKPLSDADIDNLAEWFASFQIEVRPK